MGMGGGSHGADVDPPTWRLPVVLRHPAPLARRCRPPSRTSQVTRSDRRGRVAGQGCAHGPARSATRSLADSLRYGAFAARLLHHARTSPLLARVCHGLRDVAVLTW